MKAISKAGIILITAAAAYLLPRFINDNKAYKDIYNQIKNSPLVTIKIPDGANPWQIAIGECPEKLSDAERKMFLNTYSLLVEGKYHKFEAGMTATLPDINKNGTIDMYVSGKPVHIPQSYNNSNTAKDPLENIIKEVTDHQIFDLAENGYGYSVKKEHELSAKSYKHAVEELENIRKNTKLHKDEINYLTALEILYLTKGADVLNFSWSDDCNIPLKIRAGLEDAREMYQRALKLRKVLDASFLEYGAYNINLPTSGDIVYGQKRVNDMLGGKNGK